ncbi:MAG: hypothetical protein MJ135_07710 [Oscillospiraceae bacterium]|nr:hypothetical protein [Oscillospiraceae bacterium]
MKKIISLLLCIAIVLSFAACGKKPAAPAPEVDLPVAPEGGMAVAPGPDDDQPDLGPTPIETADDPDAPSEAPSAGSASLGSALLEVFRAEAGSAASVKELAEKLGAASDKADGPALMIDDAAEGYLPGFTQDVTGFKSGAAFLPMIGSIPYAGYVFEAEDPAAFLEGLKEIADPRWNICTEAEETVCEIVGSYVLFAMLPGD